MRERFAQQGYLVYWVKPQGIFSGGKVGLSRGKIKQSSFVIFNQQFLTLIRAGLPILTALGIADQATARCHAAAVLENVRERVKSGELLSDSFAAQGVFPKMYTTTLMAGEKSGNMEEVLGRYIAFQRLTMTFRKKLLVSLVYPALLVTVVIDHGVVSGHVRGAGVCQALRQPGCEAACDHRDHAHRRHAGAQKYMPFIALGLARRGSFPVALEEHRPRRRTDRSDAVATSLAGRYSVEVPGGNVFADAFDPAAGRHAAGSGDGNRRRIGQQPEVVERRVGRLRPVCARDKR